MNSITDDQFSLDGSEASWEMTFQSPMGETYKGVFRFKALLSPIDQVRIDRDYRELIGPTSPTMVSTTVDNIAFCAANLKHRVVKSPPFWDDGSTLYPGTQLKGETELLVFVMDAALKAEGLYREKLKKRHEDGLNAIKGHLEKLKEKAEKESEEAKINKELEEMDSKK